MKVNIDKLFEIIDIKPKNVKLYYEALTHKTFTNENSNFKSYEKLEYVGDSILQMKSSLYIYKHFKNISEGTMSSIRSKNVSYVALAKIIKTHGINKFLICSNNVEVLQKNEKICSDIFESLIAAIYLDLGDEALEKFLTKFFYPYIDKTPTNKNNLTDSKTLLQELLQPIYKKPIIYVHKKIFDGKWKTKVICDDNVYGQSIGKTKKESETKAAQDALRKLKL